MPDEALSKSLSELSAAGPLTGTEQAYVVQGGNSRRTTAQAIAALAPGTDLAFTASTRTLASSTGNDVVLPEATTTAAGLMSAAAAAAVWQAKTVLIEVRNNSGTTIPKGSAVYVTGSSGTRVAVALADASLEATAAGTLGLAQAEIPNNTDGVVVAVGELAGINTSALTEGGLIWLSETTGQLTSTRPTQPAHGVVVGYCVKSGAGTSGVVYVKTDNGLELDELHDVLITSPATGQVLRRASTGLWVNAALAAGDVGADPSGTAAAALAAHLAAADPHPNYLTPGEGNAAYAPLASVHDSVTLAASVADVLGLTGQQLGGVNPGAGADRILFWDHSAGGLRFLALGANLVITDTTLDGAGGGGGGGGYPLFSAPTGFSVTGSGTSSIALSFATGYSLPTTASQANWDAAYSERLRWDGAATGLNAATARTSLGLNSAATAAASDFATAAQGALASTSIQPGDSRLTDAREWSAATVTQTDAEAGIATDRRAWTVQRVWQAIAAWWAQSAAATKLATIANGATANATDAQLRDRSTHTGTQPVGTITGLSVGLSLPSLFSVSDSPVTGSGTLTGTLVAQPANRLLAGPTSGADAAPTMRALVTADLPTTGITPGSYTNVNCTVDATGRITAISNGTGGGGGGSTPNAYAVGNYVVPFPANVATGAAGVANTATLVPFIPLISCTISDLSARVVGVVASSLIQLMIYETTGTSVWPTNCVGATAATLSGATATTIEGTVTPFNLTAGRVYWMAANANTSAITMVSVATTSMHTMSIVGASTAAGVFTTGPGATVGYTTPITFGTTPSLSGATFTAGTGARSTLVALKVSALL